MMAGDFEIEVDAEGVCRVVGHPDEWMTFSTRDFGRFLTEFLAAVCRESDEDVSQDESLQ